ncbi:MAG: class I SAM-dependent RNA methyltransferase, partial [Chloroflexi bacterium]|nr:class I SAM-dependent RNA methyltransferase [Chloroflexota bacterium]
PTTGDWSQADVLAMLVLDRLDAGPGDVLLDCYSGVGVFAALAAQQVSRVVGIEYAASAVADARANCADLSNVQFLQGKAEEVIREAGGGFDVAIVDPARVGCAKSVVDALLESRASRLVYVSCDPATLARDLLLLVDGGFALRDIQPLDMFPQTHHIECVAMLDR